MGEPQHISEILPGLMDDLERRRETRRQAEMRRTRRRRVLAAVGGLMRGADPRGHRRKESHNRPVRNRQTNLMEM
jgi:hypothetical protein